MTTRQEIIKVGEQYGWAERVCATPELICLTFDFERQPHVVYVRFRDLEGMRVMESSYSNGQGSKMLTGGVKAIKQHLRQNGRKA